MQRGQKEQKVIPNPQITVKSVCGACNNGWMSDPREVEHPANREYAPEPHAAVGGWAANSGSPLGHTKTAMVLDSSRPRAEGPRFYLRPDECRRTCEQDLSFRRELAFGWVKYRNQAYIHAGMTHFLYSRQDNGKPMIRSWIGTFVVGHFAAQIITQHTLADFDDHTVRDLAPKPGDWDNRLIQIWPAEHDWLMWPPGVPFTNGGPAGVGHFG